MHRVLGITVLIGSTVVLSSSEQRTFTPQQKAYYADANVINFVRPGLYVKITGATIGSDGTIQANVLVQDRAQNGAGLDVTGAQTPGAVSLSFAAAFIPKGTQDWVPITSAPQTSSRTGQTANQPAADSGGKLNNTGSGQYTYVFATKAPSGFDMSQTTRIGVWASRNLTEFDLGTNQDDDTFDFVPSGGAMTDTHDVTSTVRCNQCHDPLRAHGGSRRSVTLCVICHNPGGNGVQTVDPDTGNSIDAQVMIHKIHAGAELPSVKAGKPYQIIGFRNSVNDFSTVVFPASLDVAENGRLTLFCQMCHEGPESPQIAAVNQSGTLVVPPVSDTGVSIGTGGAGGTTGGTAGGDHGTSAGGGQGSTAAAFNYTPPANANWWLTRPSSAACGSCHDNVNFQTGENHPGGIASDRQCARCHTPSGEIPFDASIMGAHFIPQWTPGALPGVNLKIVSVTNGAAGQNPTVTFSVTDNAGNPIAPANMDLLNLVMAGPNTDYPAVFSESAKSAAAAGAAGQYTYTFKAAVPADITGSYTIGIEGYKNVTLLPGTKTQVTVRDVGFNQITDVAAASGQATPHALEVTQGQCDSCHYRISAHGTIRQNVQYCAECHNPNATDAARRPADQKPDQSIDFPVLSHRLHFGEHAADETGPVQMTPFVVWGFGNRPNDFSDVRFPADLNDCQKCHTPAGYQAPPQAGVTPVVNPRAFINPAQPTTAACTACHITREASAHAQLNTSPTLGEACGVCHGSDAQFSVDRMHARTL